MKLKSILPIALVSVVTLLITPSNGYAMPNFSRAYHKDCNFCHTQVPQLNRNGYEFRAAGFRLPDEIGQKETYSLERLFAARIQTQWTSSQTKVAGKTTGTKNELQFKEWTLYPLTGSWLGYFGSLVELSSSPGEDIEVENAYLRGVLGDEKGWFWGKVGIMHPWEGFGASDRPLGNTRPLFQKGATKAGTVGGVPANVASPFYLWNVDEVAIEAGYYSSVTGTSITARVGMGTLWKEDAGGPGDLADPQQGGGLTKFGKGYPRNKMDKSFQAVLSQFINDESSVTLYYYYSSTPYPNPFCYESFQDCDNFIPPTVFTKDKFHRFAAYANYYVVPKTVNLNGGFFYGHDSIGFNPNLNYNGTDISANSNTDGSSIGYFAEGDYHIIPHELEVGYRYDYFNPNRNLDHFTQHAHTLILSYHPVEYIEFIVDGTLKNTEQGIGHADKHDKQILANLIVIF